MYKYTCLIAYDGTDFSGWQIQPKMPTIQEEIQNKMAIILRKPIVIIGSGRTDAGVHATGQVAHFWSKIPIDPRKLRYSLNGLLPPAIRILAISPVPSSFHSQKSAISKAYHYHICTEEVPNPFQYRTMFHSWRPVDGDVLDKAAQYFVGTHDFTSFSNEPSAGAVARNPVRTLYAIHRVAEEGGFRIEFEGNGFLYKMVRNIVGVLLACATGKQPIDTIPELFAAKDRRCIGAAAPAKGLFLVRVNYPQEEEAFGKESP